MKEREREICIEKERGREKERKGQTDIERGRYINRDIE